MKTLKSIFVCIFLGIMLTSCAKPVENLRVGLMSDINSIPFYVADSLGYLENVDIEIFMSPVDRDAALYSGNLDGAIFDLIAVGLSKNKDFDLYATMVTRGNYGIVASKASKITKAEELAGHTVALSTSTIIEYILDSATKGVENVEKTLVPKIPSRLELLQNNKIDAIAVPEPFVSVAAKDGTLITTSDDLGLYAGVFVLTDTAIEGKKDQILKMYEAYNKAVDYINTTDKSEYLKEILEKAGLPEATMDITLPVYEKVHLPEREQVEKVVNWLLEKELIEKSLSYEELVKEVS